MFSQPDCFRIRRHIAWQLPMFLWLAQDFKEPFYLEFQIPGETAILILALTTVLRKLYNLVIRMKYEGLQH